MKQIIIIIISLICIIAAKSVSIGKPCQCEQVNKNDCAHLTEECTWDATQMLCKALTTSTTTYQSSNLAPASTQQAISTWCASNSLEQGVCQNKAECAFVGNKCIQFPGCSAFVGTTYESCQAISRNCITNGNTCIFKNSCSTYVNQISCVKNTLPDSVNNLCYWNHTINNCEDANSCVKLPKYLITDAMCRQQINHCTVHQSGSGCVASGYNCSDQETERQCGWNHSMTTKCFWFEKCLSQSCENEPSSYTTIAECTKRLKECIPKQGGGCKVKGNCESIDLPDQCVKDSIGGICHWHDNKCQDYTCLKASTTLTTHSECSTYKSSCTVNANKRGCQDRTIDNAPLEYKTTKECQEYITGSQAKATGGCKPLGGCSTIEIKDDCKVDYQKKQCFWNENATINKCNYLQCNLAPGPGFTDQYCNSFSTDCIAVGNQGCQDKKCPLITNKNLCVVDKDNKNCLWTSQCVLKQCSQASSTSTTYAQCQEWSSRCTVNQTLNGCLDLQQQCESYSISEQCRFLKDGTICVWDGVSQCFKKSCTTAFPITNYTTTSSCNSYRTGCVVANSGQGCVNKITQCVDSLIQDNCPSPCVWNAITKCQVKQCNNADSSKTTTTLCDGWISGCIVNATNNGCIDKPTTCTGQTQQQCNIKSKSTGDCYYNGSACVDLTCDNIATTVTTHSGCQTILNTCTLKANQQGCMTIPSTCTGLIQQQCYLKTGGRCVWSGGVCRDKLCSDAATTADFNTHDKCTAFDPSCTVTTSGVQAQGCQSKTYPAGAAPTTYANCINAPQTDCVKSINEGECYYNTTTNQCVAKTCTNITTPPTGYSDCYNWKPSCISVAQGNSCQLDVRAGLSNQVLLQQYKPCISLLPANCTTQSYCYLNSVTNQCYFQHGDCKYIPKTNCNSAAQCQVVGDACVAKSGKNSDCRLLSGAGCTSTYVFQYTCELNGANCQFKQVACTVTNEGNCEYSRYLCTWNGTQCALKPTTCAGHTAEAHCSFTLNLTACHWNGTSCENLNCSLADSTSLATCANYDLRCMVLSKSFACAPRPATCSDAQHTSENCKQLTGVGSGLCFWNGTGCVDRLCSHYTGTFNHTNCQTHMSSCTINQAGTACTSKTNDCTTYLTSDSCQSTLDGSVCHWNGSNCLLKVCGLAPESTAYDDDTKCQTWMPTCGVKFNTFGCVTRQATCAGITSQTQCYRNLADSKCYWNVSTGTCVDDICANYPATTDFNSHSKCYAMNNLCTVKATGETLVQGCTNLNSSCTSYTAQDQCNITSTSVNCIWNSSITPKCQVKSCITAPYTTSYDDHTECSAYYKDANNNEICTTGPTGGCMLRIACNLYTHQQSCVVDHLGVACFWNGTRCDYKSCLTAGTTINDHTKCQAFLKQCTDVTDPDCAAFTRPCTVNTAGNGCISIPSSCVGLIQSQCYKNSSGADCYWDSVKSACFDFTCSLAPKSASSDSDCQSFNTSCLIKQSCAYQPCEQLKFIDDETCERAQQGCTSNGVSCIPRQNCVDAKVQAACNKDINGNQCQWQDSGAKCTQLMVTINCLTAPKSLTTEQECQQYKAGCTTKLGGGCISKSTCADANVQAACSVDVVGNTCYWIQNACRIKECSDYEGTTYEACQLVGGRLDCMSDGQGKCMKSKKCNEIENIKNCYQGSDGQCLWVVGINSIGKCYQYQSCNSIPFKTHSECQRVSNYCTSDSTTCIAISKCSDNPISGCQIGTDGDCQLVLTTPQTCKLFKSCEEITYLTHSECQLAQHKCTSNGVSGCIPLNSCYNYKQKESCNISNSGIIFNTLNQIVQSNVCVWEEPNCRIKKCTDYYGSTHKACQDQLVSCTTSGQNCVAISSCELYQKEYCNLAQSTNGACIWDTNKCRQKECQDIVDSANQSICSQFNNCILLGTKCFKVEKCSKYSNQIHCYLNGLDGQCTWNDETKQCSLMTQCESANSDKLGCLNNQDKCHWTPVTESTKSTCKEHTCATKSQGSLCLPIYNWDNTQLIVCALNKSNVCVSTDPRTLTQGDCLKQTKGQYSWNSKINQCQVCNLDIMTNPTDAEFDTPYDDIDLVGYTSILHCIVLLNVLQFF